MNRRDPADTKIGVSIQLTVVMTIDSYRAISASIILLYLIFVTVCRVAWIAGMAVISTTTAVIFPGTRFSKNNV